MRIKKLSCIDPNWELENLQLSNVNLIVGKNSTGKTRTLQTIDLLVKMITQKRDLNWGAQWNILFENYKGEEITYEFSTSYQKRGVTFEKMTLDNKLVLSRNRKYNEGRAKIKNYLNYNDYDYVYPPNNKLVLHTNRDIRAYPFLEDIADWAEQSYGFKFGNISPYSLLNQQEYDLLTAVEDIPTLFKSLKLSDKKKIIVDFNSLGYNIGMFRALALIVYMQYLTSRKKPATIIIDDLCEGLDYERATKLGKLLFETALEGDIQLIATSNDNFLMEVIDLKYLNVLFRDGKKVHGINAQSNPELFEEFKFTGLSNFDFFASNYIISAQK